MNDYRNKRESLKIYLNYFKWPKNLICFIRFVRDASPRQNHKKTFVVFNRGEWRNICQSVVPTEQKNSCGYAKSNQCSQNIANPVSN